MIALPAANIITFNESVSNPELKELLDTFREKLVLPTYLPEEQRKKIYNPKLKQILQNDPVTLEIDEVVHKFRHVDRMSLPNCNDLVKSVLKSMKTPADIQNLPPLLEGCKRAPRKVTERHYPSMIRLASKLNSLNVILDMVKAVDRTGFKLNSSEKIDELFVWIQYDAIASGWDKAKTERALKRTQLVLNLLEAEKAHRPKPDHAGRFPFHRDPQFLAARLHMAAVQAVHHQERKDVGGKVAKFADELVKLWPEGKGLLDLQPDESYRERTKMSYYVNRNRYLLSAAPVLNGLTLAAQVVDPGLAMQLQNRADAVDAEIKVALAQPQERASIGQKVYNQLFNPEAETEQGEEAAVAE